MTAVRQIRSHIALRGIAALLVVDYHLQFAPYRLPFEEQTEFFRRGYLWVDLFFVLSGFIISYVNDAERSLPFGRAETVRFLRGRFTRLYPLHIFCLVAFVVGAGLVSGFASIGHHWVPYRWDAESWIQIGAQALLINAWAARFSGWNISSWSISAELVAYLLFPLLVSLHAVARRSSEAAMLAGACAFMAAIAATTANLDITASPLAPVRCVAGFMLGMLVYFHREAVTRLPLAVLALLQAAATIAIVVLLAVPVNDVAIIPCFVLLVATTWTDRGPLARLLVRRPLLWLGEISYSIYLIHIPLGSLLGLAWSRFANHAHLDVASERIVWLAVALGSLVAASGLTYRFVERPARKWLARRLTGHEARPIALSPAAP